MERERDAVAVGRIEVVAIQPRPHPLHHGADERIGGDDVRTRLEAATAHAIDDQRGHRCPHAGSELGHVREEPDERQSRCSIVPREPEALQCAHRKSSRRIRLDRDELIASCFDGLGELVDNGLQQRLEIVEVVVEGAGGDVSAARHLADGRTVGTVLGQLGPPGVQQRSSRPRSFARIPAGSTGRSIGGRGMTLIGSSSGVGHVHRAISIIDHHHLGIIIDDNTQIWVVSSNSPGYNDRSHEACQCQSPPSPKPT